MAHRPRPMGREFVRAAPVRLVFEREIAAAPERVFRALAGDVTGWTEWFGAGNAGPPPRRRRGA